MNYFLEAIFAYGMYLRGWRGQGEYPVKNIQNMHNDPSSIVGLIELIEFIYTLPEDVQEEIKKMPIAIYEKSGNYQVKTTLIYQSLIDFAWGKYSCRMMSNHLIWSACYYGGPFNIDIDELISFY